jgi:hypothetical protein
MRYIPILALLATCGFAQSNCQTYYAYGRVSGSVSMSYPGNPHCGLNPFFKRPT